MRQLCLPLYAPCFPAPERIALSLLGPALHVTEQVLRDEHPSLERAPALDQHAPLAVATAKLIVDRCTELRALIDFYDAVVDELLQPDDDELPF